MKKRVAILFLALLLLLPLALSAKADDTGICFTAVGDKLLELSSMASFTGGSVYVPANVFSTFGVYYNYYNSDSIAHLYTNDKQVFFNMSTGKSYDSLETELGVSAIFRNGQVYVPISWTCTYFGLYYSYISGSGSGDIVRIKNGGEVLIDAQFLSAATSLMKGRYIEYFGAVEPGIPTPTPTPTPTPSESPSPEQEDDRRDTYVSLAFTGIPNEGLLNIFDKNSYSATFFVTQKQAEENGDILRRIYGSGHNIGVYCKSDPDVEFEDAANAVFFAVQAYPSYITSPSSISELCVKFSETRGLINLSPWFSIREDESSSSVISRLETASGYVTILMPIGEDSERELAPLLQYLYSKKFTVLPLRETYI